MESQEKTPNCRNKPLRLVPSSAPVKSREKSDEPKKRKTPKTSGIGPMCIFIKEHKESMCRRLEKLYRKKENGLLDLDIECEGKSLQAHKIVMAAASKFFCSVLCKSAIKAFISVKLEDFGLCLTYVAVQHLLEFIYGGKVTIPGENLIEVCAAAHALGIHGLVDFLPASSTVTCVIPNTDVDLLSSSDSDWSNDGTASEDESSLRRPNFYNIDKDDSRPVETNENHVSVRNVRDQDKDTTSGETATVPQFNFSHPSSFGHTSQSNQTIPIHPVSSTITTISQPTIIEPSSSSAQFQLVVDPLSPGQQLQSRGRVRLVNQKGILANTSQNIHTSANSEMAPTSGKNFGQSCKGLFNDTFTSEEQMVPNVFEHEQTSNSQIQNSQNGYLPVLQPHSFAPWTPLNSLEMPSNAGAFHLNENVTSTSSQATESLTFSENTWSTVADQNWLQESRQLQEIGDDSRNSFVSSDNFSLWMSDMEALPTSEGVTPLHFTQPVDASLQRVFFPPPQTSDVITLEPMQLCRDLIELGSENNTHPGRSSPNFLNCQAETSLSPEFRPPSLLPGVISKKKRPDLEVRKDLIEPSSVQMSDSENVFQQQDVSIASATSIMSNNFVTDGETSSHICTQCNISFQTFSQLNVHIKFVHDCLRTQVCHVCREPGFREKESLKLHLYQEHGIGEYFRCEECSFKTSIKTSFTKHLTTHTENRLFCEVCSKTFKSKSGLKLHIKQHEGDGMMKCSFCDFKTASQGTYRNHLAVKHKKTEEGEDISMEVTCDMCSFTCFADAQLRSHILRRHTSKENMPFQCSSCDYATVEKAALEKHVRFKHTNERPFVCQTCGFSTHTHSAMSRHVRGHSKTKPHSCDICGASYADRKRLRDHLLTHAGETPYSCEFCTFATKRKDYLQAHVRRIHPEVGNSPESSDSNLLVDFMSMADSANIDQKESKVFSMDASSNFGLHQTDETHSNSEFTSKSHIVGRITSSGIITAGVPSP